MRREYRADPILEAIGIGQIMPYETTNVNARWISDGLKKELETWDYSKPGVLGPVLINAPTGSGKSTFVMNDLASRVNQYGKYVLLLSNRSALELQQKYLLTRRTNGAAWSGQTLAGLTQFGNVLVFTYQSVCSALTSGALAQNFPIGAVVFDEVHFFASDSTFNPRTEYIYKTILECCHSSQRIYMSATPDDVRDLIAYEEYRLKLWRDTNGSVSAFSSRMRGKYTKIKEYRFAANYDYVRLHFFDDWEGIEAKIKSDTSDDKWLLFVNGKDQGRETKKNLGTRAMFIDSASKEANWQRFSDLARREMFEAKVLISTSVLDNGVNFHDLALKHVVIDSIDYVEVKQMLGRKRVEANESVDVYIMQKSLKSIELIRQNLRSYYQMVQEFKANQELFIHQRWGTLSESQQQMFEPINGCIMPDGTGRPSGLIVSGYVLFQLDQQMVRLEDLSDRLAKEGEEAFVHVVAQWFGKRSSSEVVIEEPLRERVGKEVFALFERYAKVSPLLKETMKEFEDKVKDVVRALGSDGPKLRNGESRENANINAVAKFFMLPYGCKKENNRWVLKEVERKAEENSK